MASMASMASMVSMARTILSIGKIVSSSTHIEIRILYVLEKVNLKKLKRAYQNKCTV